MTFEAARIAAMQWGIGLACSVLAIAALVTVAAIRMRQGKLPVDWSFGYGRFAALDDPKLWYVADRLAGTALLGAAILMALSGVGLLVASLHGGMSRIGMDYWAFFSEVIPLAVAIGGALFFLWRLRPGPAEVARATTKPKEPL